jgi:hypothetical protein
MVFKWQRGSARAGYLQVAVVWCCLGRWIGAGRLRLGLEKTLRCIYPKVNYLHLNVSRTTGGATTYASWVGEILACSVLLTLDTRLKVDINSDTHGPMAYPLHSTPNLSSFPSKFPNVDKVSCLFCHHHRWCTVSMFVEIIFDWVMFRLSVSC